MTTEQRTEYRMVSAKGRPCAMPSGPYVLDWERTAAAYDERYPSLAPHRIEQRIVTSSPWVPIEFDGGNDA